MVCRWSAAQHARIARSISTGSHCILFPNLFLFGRHTCLEILTENLEILKKNLEISGKIWNFPEKSRHFLDKAEKNSDNSHPRSTTRMACSMDDLPAHLWWYVSTPCSFFHSGNCKHGNKCQYFHATSNGAVTIVDAVVYIESLDKDTERYQLQRFARSIGATTRCKLHNSGRYDGLQSAHIHFTSVFDANAFMEHMVSYQKRAECKLNQVTTYTYMPSSVQSHPAEQLPLSTFLPLSNDAPAVLCSADVLSDASDSVVLESNDNVITFNIYTYDVKPSQSSTQNRIGHVCQRHQRHQTFWRARFQIRLDSFHRYGHIFVHHSHTAVHSIQPLLW